MNKSNDYQWVALLAACLVVPTDLLLAEEQSADTITGQQPAEAAAAQSGERKQKIGAEGDDKPVEAPSIADDVRQQDLVFYGSGRVRLSGSDGEVRISDNRSRLGVYGYKFFRPHLEIFTRIELGTDLGGTIDDILFPPENPPDNSDGALFLRVGKIGIGTTLGDFSLGKQWSVFYNVSGYTDRFAVFGATATGTYNAGTDGGGSGTGRADNSFKYQSYRKVALGLQAQDNGLIPLTNDQKYDAGLGGSLTWEVSQQWSVGAAYNSAFIDELDQELIDLGLTGDSEAGVLGVSYAHEPVYIAATLASHKNQETTDANKFIDAAGGEIYGRYLFSPRWRAIGGANYLRPDNDDPQAGQYEISSIIFGLQWAYGDTSFRNMLYVEGELRGGRNFDGSPQDNALTLGIRYSFDI